MLKKNLLGKINIVLMFVVTQLLALVVVHTYPEEYKAFQGMETSPIPILIFFAEILAFTAFLIYLARKGKDALIRGLMALLFFLAISTTLEPILLYFHIPLGSYLSLVLAISLSYATFRWPRWYVVNGVGVFVGGGIAAILGFSLAPVVLAALLVLLAAYDYYSVYRSKHMLELAEVADRTNIPLLFVSPTGTTVAKIEGGKKTEEHTYFLGFGDAIIPGAMAVSVLVYMGDIAGSLLTVLGGTVGLVALLHKMKDGEGYPGLPFINGGALGFLLMYSVYLQLFH